MPFKEYECPHCGFEAKSAGGLTQHIDLKHGNAQAPLAPAEQPTEPDNGKVRCRVHRTNCAEENAMVPIIVNTCNPKTGGRKVFVPGEEVELTPAQVEILRNAVEPYDIPIPGDSGIYNSPDPIKAAQVNYPGHRIKQDPHDGVLHALKDVSNYIVERL